MQARAAMEPKACTARILRLVVAFVCSVGFAASAHAADLDHVLASAMSGTKVPALSILTMLDGKISGIAVRGVRRFDRRDPARINDEWLIGSDAKPITATLIAKLIDEQKLSWDAPLWAMLPGLAAKMRPEYRTVTLLQLLTHLSGLPHDYSDLRYFETFFTDKRPLPQQRYEYIMHALTDKPIAAPGTHFSYSNTGFVVAAVISERKTGVPYEELIRREIFAPLGMTHVGFGMTPEGQPQGHHGNRVVTLKDTNPVMFAPAGNVHMSLQDWAAFCLDQMAGYHGHGKLLKAPTYRMMQTRRPGTENGISWGIADSLAGREGPVLEHAGSDGNWMALVALFPSRQSGVLVAANAGPDMGGDRAAKAALKAVVPELAPPMKPRSKP